MRQTLKSQNWNETFEKKNNIFQRKQVISTCINNWIYSKINEFCIIMPCCRQSSLIIFGIPVSVANFLLTIIYEILFEISMNESKFELLSIYCIHIVSHAINRMKIASCGRTPHHVRVKSSELQWNDIRIYVFRLWGSNRIGRYFQLRRSTLNKISPWMHIYVIW